MKIEPTTKANRVAILLLLLLSIAYHVILSMASASKNGSLFHSGIEFSTNAVRNLIEPSANNSFSPFGN